MDLERALAELGLTRMQAQAELRRAYLKKVKQHPPERDPEGFKRVRSAYELLTSWPPEFAAVIPALRVELPALQPAKFDAALPEPVPTSSAIVEPPEPFEAPQVEGLPELEPDPIRQRRVVPPGALSLGDLEQSVDVLLGLYRDPAMIEELPYTAFCLDAVLALFVKKQPDRARELLEAFDAYAGRTALRIDVQQAARWHLTRELVALAPHVQSSVTRAIARGLRSGKMHVVADAIEDAGLAGRANFARTMERTAPSLWNAVRPMLRAEARPIVESGGGGFNSPWRWLWIIVVVMPAMRLISAERDYEPNYKSPPLTFTPPKPIVDESPPDAGLGLSSPPEIGIEEKKRVLVAAVTAGDCVRVRDAWPLFRTALTSRGPAHERGLDELKRKIDAMCPELEIGEEK